MLGPFLWGALKRPVVELQIEAADCGYVCVSAILSLLGRPKLVHEIKATAGTTSRGLTLRQLRDALRAFGIKVEAVSFDRMREESYPNLGVVLLEQGHYIVIARRRGEVFEVFDPQIGWYWTDRRKLKRSVTGLGLQVTGKSNHNDGATAPSRKRSLHEVATALWAMPQAKWAVGVFALAQIVTLALPLLSMWSVDRIIGQFSLGGVGIVALGFVCLSTTNILISLVADLLQSHLRRRASIAVGGKIFRALAAKAPYWFELNPPASLLNRMTSMSTQMEYYLEVVRVAGSVGITFIVGFIALMWVSPWLALPGLCTMMVSIVLDLSFHKPQQSGLNAVVEAAQRRQAFILDTLSQLPLLARYGATGQARFRFTSLVRRATTVERRLQSINDWRAALTLLIKSAETLLFVSLSAALMSRGEFTVGGFVALGAYKDLLAGAVASLFQLAMRGRALRVHHLQAAALLDGETDMASPTGQVTHGRISVSNVSFGYGSLDAPILRDLDLEVFPGECVVIRGASGGGKSTIAKLIVGSLSPSSGFISVDGAQVARHMTGSSAVLQNDRLVHGSIRENITLFRKSFTDGQVLDALKLAAIDDFVLGLPMRLNTMIGESVVGLSGGQRQRLLLARAVLDKPKLLILDEATSSLDVATEASILESLRGLGTTIVMIAHRPEVWALADTIYELEDGRLRLVKRAVFDRLKPTPSASPVTS
jgi:ATP-binding cassette, subfamily B, bacterial CvaB/MchF/RaxB